MSDREEFEAWWVKEYAAGTEDEREWAFVGWQAALAAQQKIEPVAWTGHYDENGNAIELPVPQQKPADCDLQHAPSVRTAARRVKVRC